MATIKKVPLSVRLRDYLPLGHTGTPVAHFLNNKNLYIEQR